MADFYQPQVAETTPTNRSFIALQAGGKRIRPLLLLIS